MIDEALAWRVEQACFNAWPSLNQVHFGDWCGRFGAGLSRRNNSANPLSPGAEEPERHLAEIEALYRRWALTPRFRVPSFLDPQVARTLQASGYDMEGETLTLFAPLERTSRASDPGLQVFEAPSPEWIAAKARLSAFSAAEADALARIVGRLAIPAGLALLQADGAPAAVAFGALHDGLLCLEAVVTDPDRRGRGFGRRLLQGLLAWGDTRGAEAVCLQVQSDNAAGLALYRRLGLTTELYRYHYRRGA